MKTKKEKQGISLIVLVITIIVMVILAGAIILTLSNSGIISKASSAVEETNLATVKEVASLAWAEAYADGVRTVEDLADGTKGLKTRIEEAFEKNNIDVDKYKIEVTTTGVDVKLLSSMWVKEGFTVVKGDQVLKIGELVDYTATGTDYNGGWKVLGADEDGNLLIMSAMDVKTSHRLGYDTTDTTDADKLDESQDDWLNGAAELDGICEPYGKGEGAVGKARSITVEDVNSVAGYDPETAENGNPYGKGEVLEYGNEVTYAWDGDSKIKFSGTLNDNSGSANYSYSVFTWYDEKTGTFPSVDKGATTMPLPTLKSNYYFYYAPVDLTTISSTKEESKEAYQMLFGNDDTWYWLASPCVITDTYYAGFGVRSVSYSEVGYFNLWYSFGGAEYGENGVRAVVTLSSDIQFTEYTADGWTY